MAVSFRNARVKRWLYTTVPHCFLLSQCLHRLGIRLAGSGLGCHPRVQCMSAFAAPLSVELSLLTLSRHRLRVSPDDRFRSRQAIPGACPWVSEDCFQLLFLVLVFRDQLVSVCTMNPVLFLRITLFGQKRQTGKPSALVLQLFKVIIFQICVDFCNQQIAKTQNSCSSMV